MQLRYRAIALKTKGAARENTRAWCALLELQQRDRDNGPRASGARAGTHALRTQTHF